MRNSLIGMVDVAQTTEIGCEDSSHTKVNLYLHFARISRRMLLPFSAAYEVGMLLAEHALQDVVFHFATMPYHRPVSPAAGPSCSSCGFWHGRGPLEQFLIHCLGRGVHIIEDGGESMQPKQVPGDF